MNGLIADTQRQSPQKSASLSSCLSIPTSLSLDSILFPSFKGLLRWNDFRGFLGDSCYLWRFIGELAKGPERDGRSFYSNFPGHGRILSCQYLDHMCVCVCVFLKQTFWEFGKPLTATCLHTIKILLRQYFPKSVPVDISFPEECTEIPLKTRFYVQIILEMATYSICLFKIHGTPLHAEGWKQPCSEAAGLILFNLEFFKHINYGIYISPFKSVSHSSVLQNTIWELLP